MKRVILLQFVFLKFAFAQAPANFFCTFGGSGDDVAYSCKQTLSGDYIVAGSTSSYGDLTTDFYLFFVHKMGYATWYKHFGGSGNEIAKSVIQLPDSNFVLVGFTSSYGAGGYDAWIVKTDKNGLVIWDKTFGGADWDFANDVVLGTDGNLFVTGYTESFGNGGKDGFVAKFDQNGNLLKTGFYGGILDDELSSIIVTNDGELACVGYTRSRGDQNGDGYFLKINKSCDTIFTKVFGGASKDFATDLLQRPDDEYVICGGNTLSGQQYSRSWMYSINSIGDSLWENTYYASQTDEAFVSVAQSKNALLNSCYVRNVPVPSLAQQINIFLAKPQGWPVIVNSSGGYEDEIAYNIEPTSDSGYIVVGSTKSFGSLGTDAIFFKHDSTIVNYQSLVGFSGEKTSEFPFGLSYKNESIFISGENVDFPVEVTVSDISGRVIYETQINITKKQIETNFSNGIYIVSARNINGKSANLKLVVK